MDMTVILEAFTNPETIRTLEQWDLIVAILFTIAMGMGTTVVVLTMLMYSTKAIYALFGAREDSTLTSVTIPVRTEPATPSAEDEELAVVIASAIAAMLNTESDKVVIRSIKQV